MACDDIQMMHDTNWVVFPFHASLGPLDVAQTELDTIPSPKIATQGVFFTVCCIPRDIHGNPTEPLERLLHCDIKKVRHDGVCYSIMISCSVLQENVNGESIDHDLVIRKAVQDNGYEFCLKLKESGHCVGTFKYGGHVLGQTGFTIVCLTGEKC